MNGGFSFHEAEVEPCARHFLRRFDVGVVQLVGRITIRRCESPRWRVTPEPVIGPRLARTRWVPSALRAVVVFTASAVAASFVALL
jgi:hypothetical protein